MEMTLEFESTGLQKVKDIKIPDIFNRRLKTGIKKIDVLFDEGILPGSAATLTASAGCGKTTLMLQVLQGLAKNGYNVGYFSGEESIYQLAYTAERVGVKDVKIANITDIDTIKGYMNELDLCVIDSFQALTTKTKLNSRQLEKYAVQELTRYAKDTECTVIFIMHLTKSGDLKGGTIVPHTVDANVKIVKVPDAELDDARCIYFEKNRFGPLNELECTISKTGFDFNAVVVKEDQGTVPKVNSKKVRKVDDTNKILELPDGFSLGDAAKALDGNVNRARYLLREQEILQSIEKYGRGQFAIWRKVS
jgi:predicted ATP-dependent serine protease